MGIKVAIIIFCLLQFSACSTPVENDVLPKSAEFSYEKTVTSDVALSKKIVLLEKKNGDSVFFLMEVADSPDSRRKGLMFREFLADGEGMLFVYDKESIMSFWMKNTLIPLDMIFVDADKKVVNVVQNAKPCDTTECPIISSVFPAKYALEINAGLVLAHNIEVGDSVTFLD